MSISEKYTKENCLKWIQKIQKYQCEAALGRPFEEPALTVEEMCMLQRNSLLAELKYYRDQLDFSRRESDPYRILRAAEGVKEQLQKIEDYCVEFKQLIKGNTKEHIAKVNRTIREFKQHARNGTFPNSYSLVVPIGNVLVSLLNDQIAPNTRDILRTLKNLRHEVSSSTLDRVLDEMGVKDCMQKLKTGHGGTEEEKIQMRSEMEAIGMTPPTEASLETLTQLYEREVELKREAEEELDRILKKE